MSKIPLYNDDEAMTPLAQQMQKEFIRLITPFIQKWYTDENVKAWDMETILCQVLRISLADEVNWRRIHERGLKN